ncbi:MAG: peptidyl-alpha-hydroxyglycine alpha-amidating lyase family protein [Patescibacteria group bacterium]|nr:peptidyl-alpha-hydroxyglycine alpha-amidating lyase family protein [Patescibacteria group bacterium]
MEESKINILKIHYMQEDTPMRLYNFIMIIPFLFCFCAKPEQKTEAVSPYKLVPGWPELPAGWALDATTGVAIDSLDQVYILNRSAHPLLCFSREGKLIRSWGEGMFKEAHGLRIGPDNSIWTTDTKDHIVMKFTPEGKLLMTLGTKGDSGETDKKFYRPTDMAFAPSGDIYVSDGYGNSRVAKFSKDGKFILAWGTKGAGEGQFDLPHTVRLDSKGQVYVGDRNNGRIQIFTADGKFINQWANIGQPWGLWITPDDMFYIADGKNSKIMKLNITGEILESWGKQGPNPGEFDLCHQIAVDSKGDLYITEITNKRIQKFTKM